jgi:hypothetical protein
MGANDGMKEMRAIVKQGRSVRVCEVPVPEPGPGEVLIRVEVAGVCRTDVYVVRGKLSCAASLAVLKAGIQQGVSPSPGDVDWAPSRRIDRDEAMPDTSGGLSALSTPTSSPR